MSQQASRWWSPRAARAVPVLAPLVLAAALAGAAVVTVERAGCDAPGRYVATAAGVEFVGGCVTSGDLPLRPGQDPNTDEAAARG